MNTQELNVKMNVSSISTRPDNLMNDMPRGTRHYDIELEREPGQYMKVYYSMGPAHTAGPGLEDILRSVISDAQFSAYGFEEFCAELSYDTDSRKAFAIYTACASAARQLEHLFPEYELDELAEMFEEE